MQLNEKNLRKDTLRSLIDPNIDIDMYTPKIQKDSIVVVFRVLNNFDAGYDLSSFIEKLPFDILDTEVQEVPTPDNMYEIYAEFERNEQFPYNLTKVIEAIQQLGDDDMSFMGNFYQQEEPIEVTEDTINKHVRLIVEEELNEFLEMSMAKAIVEGKYITLRSSAYNHEMVFEDVQRLTDEDAIALMREGWAMMGGLNEAILGHNYSAVQVKDGAVLVERDGKHLLFK